MNLPEGKPKSKMPVLEAILAATQATLPALRLRRRELDRAAADRPQPADFASGLRGDRVALIAEVKRRSPSAGAINEALDPVALATAYADGGAAAISVLTDGPFFGGSLADLTAIAAAVSRPTLRKDFILDEVQLLEARAAGAAAALLIVRALDDSTLQQLIEFADQLGLATLVETHTAGEVRRAVDAGARIVGVNSRDLDDFSIDRAWAWQLLSQVPSGLIAVAESGMAIAADVEEAAAAGADAILIGSALAASGNPREGALAVAGVRRRGR
ncbi:MAG: indole-3-glycerol phosphate synthase TrpC [Gemmatimonadota bacterium]